MLHHSCLLKSCVCIYVCVCVLGVGALEGWIEASSVSFSRFLVFWHVFWCSDSVVEQASEQKANRTGSGATFCSFLARSGLVNRGSDARVAGWLRLMKDKTRSTLAPHPICACLERRVQSAFITQTPTGFHYIYFISQPTRQRQRMSMTPVLVLTNSTQHELETIHFPCHL